MVHAAVEHYEISHRSASSWSRGWAKNTGPGGWRNRRAYFVLAMSVRSMAVSNLSSCAANSSGWTGWRPAWAARPAGLRTTSTASTGDSRRAPPAAERSRSRQRSPRLLRSWASCISGRGRTVALSAACPNACLAPEHPTAFHGEVTIPDLPAKSHAKSERQIKFSKSRHAWRSLDRLLGILGNQVQANGLVGDLAFL
jgi:hypothetical protein